MFDEDKNKNKPRGMFDEPSEEKPKVQRRMFSEDEKAHHMTPRKQKIIAAIVVAVAVVIAVVWMMLAAKWRHEANLYIFH